MAGWKKYFFILISQSYLQNEIGDCSFEPGPGILFTKLQLLPCILLLSHFSLENGHRLMDEEKGKNREFWLKTHNVAANSWGKGGK
jgi:hypothetical protein